MRYLALIYADESDWEGASDDERRTVYDRYATFAEAGRAAGVVIGGNELASTRDATTVRVREDDTLVTDGPYAEAREALGGFFVLECDSLGEALDWAARIPAAERGAVEVRPVYVDPQEGTP